MKKTVIALIFMLMVSISLTGCGSSDKLPENEASNGAKADGGASMSGEFESDDIKLINDLYSEEDMEFIKSIQGKITSIDSGGTFPVLVAGGKVYSEEYGALKEVITLDETPERIMYFDSTEIGENIFAFKDGKISLVPFNDNGISFEGLDFNQVTDYVAEIGLSSFYKIARSETDGYVIYDYEDMDGTGEITLYDKDLIDGYETSEYDAINVKEIIPLENQNSGYSVYVITDGGDLYQADTTDAAHGKMAMETSSPIASNVENVFASADVVSNLVAPIYSKAGDDTYVYSWVRGADLVDAADNFEISFALPEGHASGEINNIFRVSDKLVFVFENGDVYRTEDIQKEERTTYELEKLDDISKLNSDGSVIDMAGASVMDDNIYLLMSDGKLYHKKI